MDTESDSKTNSDNSSEKNENLKAKISRVILFLFFSAVILTQYQNCSSGGQSDLASSGEEALPAQEKPGPPWLKIDVNSIIVKSNEDHFETGGTCYVGDSLDNYITYSIKESGTNRLLNIQYNNSSSVPVTVRSDARCENGKYYLVVFVDPMQNGPNPSIQSYTLELQLNVKNKTNNQWEKTQILRKELTIY